MIQEEISVFIEYIIVIHAKLQITTVNEEIQGDSIESSDVEKSTINTL